MLCALLFSWVSFNFRLGLPFGNNPYASLENWKKHSPSPDYANGPYTKIYDESFALGLQAEAGYWGFWVGLSGYGGTANWMVMDTLKDELVGNMILSQGAWQMCGGYDMRAYGADGFVCALGAYYALSGGGSGAEYIYPKGEEVSLLPEGNETTSAIGVRFLSKVLRLSYLHPIGNGGTKQFSVAAGYFNEPGPFDTTTGGSLIGVCYEGYSNKEDRGFSLGCLLGLTLRQPEAFFEKHTIRPIWSK